VCLCWSGPYRRMYSGESWHCLGCYSLHTHTHTRQTHTHTHTHTHTDTHTHTHTNTHTHADPKQRAPCCEPSASTAQSPASCRAERSVCVEECVCVWGCGGGCVGVVGCVCGGVDM